MLETDKGLVRTAVTDAFGHRHDVRHNILSLKSPVVRAASSESRLHFIGDTHATSRPHMFVNVFQVILRKHYASTDALN